MAKTVARTLPLDQCIACTQKHIADALCAYNEYTYQMENRLHVMGELQLAIHHSSMKWKEIATQCREICHMIQNGDDAKYDLQAKWRKLVDLVNDVYLKEHPDVLERLEEMERLRKESEEQ